jgi:hypothetical protein
MTSLNLIPDKAYAVYSKRFDVSRLLIFSYSSCEGYFFKNPENLDGGKILIKFSEVEEFEIS